MTAQVISLVARRTHQLAGEWAARQNARQVTCPYCGADPGRPCTNRGTEQARPEGPHRGRIAAAEAALEATE